ncbi:hypothetical protein EDD18DRAFT_1202355 [Armillaria luteobubalina]|uniref:F-box domain-containing protein n=1 Tax=Armillaria luteobubalina TaxID=153913 RepID=A0AA39PE93_9AGAR|nr:hypothetical protein EDD18DRAFT_1202355 [Armillaria luteobubalina]
MLLSLPNEILDKITFEADNLARQQLRRTCKLFSNIATPFVLQAIRLDLSWTQLSDSDLLFLTSLVSGPKLAQYVTRLSLFHYLSESSQRNASRSVREAIIKKKQQGSASLDALFLEAIPLMTSLRALLWSCSGDSGPSYVNLVFERFGSLPILSDVAIYVLGAWDIPCSLLRHIRNFKYDGPRTADVVTLLVHNLGLKELNVSFWHPGLEQRESILFLFSSLPRGTYSTVEKLKIAHTDNRLYVDELPNLIPHLRHLKNLETLHEGGIHLPYLSCHDDRIGDALLSYLMSYRGLCELSLRLWNGIHSTPDDAHIEDLLNVITSHSWSLTTVRIEPDLSGAWCLDHPMLDALALCRSLQSLHVRAYEARTEAKANNVIDRTLESFVTLWPNLWDLQIHAVSQSYGFDALRRTASQIHKHILAFRFASALPARRILLFSSDFANYSIRIHDEKNNIHAFKVEYLKDWGEKELQRRSQRKYMFWKSFSNSDDD